MHRYEEWREEGKKSKKERKHKKLKDDVMNEVIKSRYGYDLKDIDKDPKNVISALIDYDRDSDKRYAKYGSRRRR